MLVTLPLMKAGLLELCSATALQVEGKVQAKNQRQNSLCEVWLEDKGAWRGLERSEKLGLVLGSRTLFCKHWGAIEGFGK